MPDTITQVVLRTTDNVIANFVTNTWSFATDPADLADMHTDLWAKYNAFLPQFSPALAQNNHEIVSYDRADPSPRAPILTTQHNFSVPPSGSPAPSEVAICLSFQGVKASGQPQARRRGRVFLGPLRTTAIGSDGRPATALVTAAVTFGTTLLAGSGPSPLNYLWTVWSSVTPGPTTIANGWVDNAFDTQRRRGIQPSARTTF